MFSKIVRLDGIEREFARYCNPLSLDANNKKLCRATSAFSELAYAQMLDIKSIPWRRNDRENYFDPDFEIETVDGRRVLTDLKLFDSPRFTLPKHTGLAPNNAIAINDDDPDKYLRQGKETFIVCWVNYCIGGTAYCANKAMPGYRLKKDLDLHGVFSISVRKLKQLILTNPHRIHKFKKRRNLKNQSPSTFYVGTHECCEEPKETFFLLEDLYSQALDRFSKDPDYVRKQLLGVYNKTSF